MPTEKLPQTGGHDHQILLKAQIHALQEELTSVEQQIARFEAVLRAALANELIEEQELSVLYKLIQSIKKEKRQEQKMKGKKYKAGTDLKPVSKTPVKTVSPEDVQERKRLYREAMLHVHPDKFSMEEDEDKIDLATEMTAKLIHIYKSGSLEELSDFCAHLMRGNVLMPAGAISPGISQTPDQYLLKEKQRLEELLQAIKKRHLYKVLTEYADPMTFIPELKAYYDDRIFKLKKRTRKGVPETKG